MAQLFKRIKKDNSLFTLKKKKIYFLIFLSLWGINVLKNIYIEHRVNSTMREEGLTSLSSIDCSGFLKLECAFKALYFEKNITNTNYSLNVKEAKLLHVNEKIDDFELYLKGVTLSDERGAFVELKEPMDINMTVNTYDTYTQVKIHLMRKDLRIEARLKAKKNEATASSLLSINLKVNREDEVMKRIFYELYKVNLLEIMQSDDEEYSSTRGMNIPLGIDTPKVISEEIFLGEPYSSMSILLLSELETFDWVMEQNERENIVEFVNDIINKNGVSQLQINQIKEIK